MRIAIFNWRDLKNPKAGGIERVTLKHASSWKENGFSVTWFTGLQEILHSEEFNII